MLTKVIIENFKSFKNKSEFNLQATKYQSLQDTNLYNNICKGALLVGANATGKSTLIIAIKTLLDLLFKDNFTIYPFDTCLFNNKTEISFEYHFLIENKNIIYAFKFNKNSVITFEKLIIDGKLVIERDTQKGTIYVENEQPKVMDKLFSPTILLLRKCYFADFFATMQPINKLMRFLQNSIYLDASKRFVSAYNNLKLLITEADDNTLSKLNNSFSELNIGIKVNKSNELNLKNFNINSTSFLQKVKTNNPLVFIERTDARLNLPLDFESLGNQTLVNIFPAILHCCENNSILLIDEFSSGFHNYLEELVIKYFFKHSTASQVIFTSHSTNLLNSKLLRPDQIYTVDFKANEGSFIDRFSNENPREAQNLEKMYLSGKFGGLPDYNCEY